MRRARAFTAVICAMLIAGSPASARKSATGLRGIDYGRPAPDFTYDAGDGPHRISELGDKIVVVHFWATWCAPCVDEMPSFERLQHEFGDRVEIVTLNWHDPIDGRSFAAMHGWSVPVDGDPGGRAARAYAVQAVPTTLILLPGRTVAYVSVGEASWDELHEALARALTPASRL